MPLVIVEAPNKCAKIKKILGDDYEVISSVGHIMDLDKKKLGVDVDTWEPRYVVNSDKEDVVRNIKQKAKRHDIIYVATDADREGSCIGFHVRSILPQKGKTIYRSIFPTMTKKDILNGIKNPIPFNEDLFAAQRARRITDRLVGFKVSPAMWGKGLKGTSAGRVQSAALKFIVDREKEVRAFTPSEYWSLIARTGKLFDILYFGKNKKKHIPKARKEIEQIVSDIKREVILSSYAKRTRVRNPVPPFVTATMQKDAGTRFGWTGKKVMDVAQSLYAQGLCTYIRTDSVELKPENLVNIRSKIKELHGDKYLSKTPIIYKNKSGAQEAHPPIIPTFDLPVQKISSNEEKLLELITKRFMASQMSSAIFDQASMKFIAEGEKNKYEFRAKGSIKRFDGFLKVYGSSGRDNELPNINEGDVLHISKFLPKQHFTKPPPRYTDPGAFTDKMEKEGIGRPATYAATMDTLIRRAYVKRIKQTIQATEIGIMVSDFLTEYFPDVTSSAFTASMESELDQIANGKKELKPSLTKFYALLMEEIETAKASKKDTFRTKHQCKKCDDDSVMVRKTHNLKVFLGCENWPKCGFTISIDDDGNPIEGEVETGIPCPVCGNMLEEKEGRFGKYITCKGYPSCTYKGKLVNGKLVASGKAGAEKYGKKCPDCKKGDLLKRKGQWGYWLGCSGFPSCKFRCSLDSKGNPVKPKVKSKGTGKACPKCKKGELFLKKGKYGQFYGCSEYRKGCRYIGKIKKER